jgi:hypothetical protein
MFVSQVLSNKDCFIICFTSYFDQLRFGMDSQNLVVMCHLLCNKMEWAKNRFLIPFGNLFLFSYIRSLPETAKDKLSCYRDFTCQKKLFFSSGAPKGSSSNITTPGLEFKTETVGEVIL